MLTLSFSSYMSSAPAMPCYMHVIWIWTVHPKHPREERAQWMETRQICKTWRSRNLWGLYTFQENLPKVWRTFRVEQIWSQSAVNPAYCYFPLFIWTEHDAGASKHIQSWVLDHWCDQVDENVMELPFFSAHFFSITRRASPILQHRKKFLDKTSSTSTAKLAYGFVNKALRWQKRVHLNVSVWL